MKRIFLLISVISLILTACTTEENEKNNKSISVFFAKGKEWAATYTLFDGGETIFDSLYIQHIGSREEEVGLIEYKLEGNGIKSESQYPQRLQGVRSFQVSTEYSKELVTIENNKNITYKLTIINRNEKEELTLRLIGEEGNF